jgi:hypothetical protein
VPDNALPSSDAVADAELVGRLVAGIIPRRLPGNGKRAKGYRHDRASEDAVRGNLMTSLRSSAVGAALALPQAPCRALLQLVPSLLFRERRATSLAYIV